MAETYKRVEGQLAGSSTTLYTVPGGTTSISFLLLLFNTGGSAETVKVYLDNGTERQMVELSLEAGEWAEVFLRITLETGDLYKAETTSATTVNYWLSYVEIS